MDPLLAAAGAGIGAALAQVFNGHMARKEQRLERDERRRQHEQNRGDAQSRFELDFDLRKDRFLWEKEQAQAAITLRAQERMEDFRRQDGREQRARSFESLRQVFHASPDGWYIHNPYLGAYPNVNSLRLLVQLSGVSTEDNRAIENQVGQTVQQYMENSEGTPIHFPTGVWKIGAQPGSWVSSELHAWDQAIPTLVLRGDLSKGEHVHFYGDMFGFPLGNRDYEQNISFGQIPKDSKAIPTVISFIAMSVSDIYYLSNYGRMPQLPRIIQGYLEQEGDFSVMDTFIRNYQDTINVLLSERPEIGIPTALRFAESLVGLADNKYALAQTQAVEGMTEAILPEDPELAQRLSSLYTKMDRPEDAARLLNQIGRSQGIDRTTRAQLLENVL